MSTLKFKLRNSTNKSAIIQIVFNYGTNKRLRYSTGFKINNVKNWNEKDMRVKNVISENDKDLINEKLDDVQKELNSYYKNLVTNTDIRVTNDILKKFCDKLFKTHIQKPSEEPIELLDFFKWYLEHYKSHPLHSTNKPLGVSTWKTYNNAYNKCVQFNNEVYELCFNKITLQFHEDFITWLHASNYANNYIGTIIKVLKTILHAALEKDLHKNIDFTKKSFSKPSENSSQIFLDEKELDKLMKLELDNIRTYFKNGVKLDKEKLNRARDLFIISANTGLRVSDFNRLSKEKIKEHKGKLYFNIRSIKTDEELSLPINSKVVSILNKREGRPPEPMLEQHINYALKILGELAGIDDDFEKRITKGGKVRIETTKKYELISNHTGRRSFCTNALLSGIPASKVMILSNHKTERIFKNYVRATHIQKAEEISKYEFFD